MAAARDLIFSLFNVASAQDVPFGMPQCILHGLTVVLFVSHSSLLTAQGVDLAIAARDGFPL